MSPDRGRRAETRKRNRSGRTVRDCRTRQGRPAVAYQHGPSCVCIRLGSRVPAQVRGRWTTDHAPLYQHGGPWRGHAFRLSCDVVLTVMRPTRSPPARPHLVQCRGDEFGASIGEASRGGETSIGSFAYMSLYDLYMANLAM